MEIFLHSFLPHSGDSGGKKKICLPTQKEITGSLGWEDPLEETTATHSSVLAWRVIRTEEPGGV